MLSRKIVPFTHRRSEREQFCVTDFNLIIALLPLLPVQRAQPTSCHYFKETPLYRELFLINEQKNDRKIGTITLPKHSSNDRDVIFWSSRAVISRISFVASTSNDSLDGT
ncbi:hypothetical protein TNCV_4833251 [Trichonephila clavipes]|nr:hypothetical protein TNCV_4833251 [Trichonephila clavipes]